VNYVAWAFLAKDPEVSRLRALVEYLRGVEDDQHNGGEFVFGLDTRTPQTTFELISTWPGARVVPITWEDDFSKARNQTITGISSPWTAYLDPDETPNHALLSWIREMVRSDPQQPIGWLWDFANFFGGMNYRQPHFESDWHLRMWRSGRARFYRKVHELVEIDGLQESDTRSRPALVQKVPPDKFVIHAKPPERINADSELYSSMEKP